MTNLTAHVFQSIEMATAIDAEMPEAPEYWELEDFSDILPRGTEQ